MRSKQRMVTVKPWLAGINNTEINHKLPDGAVCDALNVDFDNAGRAITRTGYGQTVAMDNGHSLATIGGKSLICRSGTLGVITAVSPSLTITDLRAGLPNDPISYAALGGEVWWSNGTDSGRCNSNNTDAPWCVPTPADIVAVFAGAGSLPAGKYRVAISHVMTSGEESAASPVVSFDLPASGSLTVTLPAAKPGTDFFRIYCTIADGEIISHYSDVVAAAASASITAAPQGIALRERNNLAPLPPGSAIAFHNGRLLSASGRYLSVSEVWDFGLYDPLANSFLLQDDITMLAPCEGGVFVGTTAAIYWYGGNDIMESVVSEVLPCGAVKGTTFRHPDNKRAGWMTEDGFVIGAPDGSVSLPQRERGFVPPIADSYASTLVRTYRGVTQLVCSYISASYDSRVSESFERSRFRYDDDDSTVAMNLATGATSRYSNWHFNSCAQLIDGEYYGVDDVGMSLLTGHDDRLTEINAVVDLGDVDFETIGIKSPQYVYVGGKSSDKNIVTIFLANGDSYDYQARTFNEDRLEFIRHDGMRGLMNLRQQWFDTVIRNNRGSWFEISSVQVLIGDSDRRIG